MRHDTAADTMITAVIRATVTATCALAGLAALAGAVTTWLNGDTHWAVTWALVVALSTTLIVQLGHASDIDRLTETVRMRLRTDVDAWRTSEPEPIGVDDVVEHVVSGRRGIVEWVEHRHGTDGAWVAFDDVVGDTEARWVPLAVLRRVEPAEEVSDDA